jgi:hypothetical protein
VRDRALFAAIEPECARVREDGRWLTLVRFTPTDRRAYGA